MSITKYPTYAKPVSIAVGLLFLAVAWVPFLPSLAGEWWGMVWFYITAPVSFVAEDTVGIGSDSVFLMFVITVICAALWSGFAFFACRLFHAACHRSSS